VCRRSDKVIYGVMISAVAASPHHFRNFVQVHYFSFAHRAFLRTVHFFLSPGSLSPKTKYSYDASHASKPSRLTIGPTTLNDLSNEEVQGRTTD